MLQIIAFGLGFVLIGMGSIARMVQVLATPLDKRKGSTGAGVQLFCTLLGLIVLVLAYLQGAAAASQLSGMGF